MGTLNCGSVREQKCAFVPMQFAYISIYLYQHHIKINHKSKIKNLLDKTYLRRLQLLPSPRHTQHSDPIGNSDHCCCCCCCCCCCLCVCVHDCTSVCVCLFVQKPQPLATLHDVVASVFGLVVGAATSIFHSASA